MKHKFFSMIAIVLAAVLCAACLSSCAPDPSTELSPSSESDDLQNTIMEVPEHLTVQLEENLAIDADISFDAAPPYRTYRAEVLRLDVDTVSNLFSGHDSIIHGSNVYESATGFTYNGWTTTGGTLSIEAGSDFLSVNYLSGWFNGLNPLLKIYGKESTVNWTDYDNRNLLLQGVDLSFSSINQALADVMMELQSLGIEVSSNAEIYSLDAEVLQSLADNYTGGLKDYSDSIKTVWTSDDECYYMILCCQCDSIPVNTHTMELTFGSAITVCYNKDGIQFLRIDQPYSILDIVEESESVISINQLQMAIQEKYSTVILTDPVTITAIDFCYTAILQSDDKYFLEPTWLVEVEQSIGEDVRYFYISFDAVTGKEQ